MQLSVNASGGTGKRSYQWFVNGNRRRPAERDRTFNREHHERSGNLASALPSAPADKVGNSSPVNVLVRTLGPPTIQFAVTSDDDKLR